MASRLHSYTIKRTLRIVATVVGSLALVSAIAFAFVRVFSISRVEVDGQGMSIELDKAKLGENLLFVPTDRLRHDLLAAYPLLGAVRFEKQYPGTLIIHLIKRQPFALLVSRGATYALDASGVVLDNAVSTGAYPILEFDVGSLAIGSIVPDPRVKASLAFLQALHGVLPIARLGTRDTSSILAVMEHTNIFLPQTGDLRAKADTLQTIIEGFRIKGTLPTVIDLRFQKPIVTN